MNPKCGQGRFGAMSDRPLHLNLSIPPHVLSWVRCIHSVRVLRRCCTPTLYPDIFTRHLRNDYPKPGEQNTVETWAERLNEQGLSPNNHCTIVDCGGTSTING